MSSLKNISAVAALLLALTSMNAQLNNVQTATVKIPANCEMCKSAIETAGTMKKVSTVQWNKETQLAVISYNAEKTSKEEILKRIALAGFDNEAYLAPDDTYASLADCCQYERKLKPKAPTEKMAGAEPSADLTHVHSEGVDRTGTKKGEMPVKSVKPAAEPGHDHLGKMDHTNIKKDNLPVKKEKSEVALSPLQAVFDHYFALKDALVATDGDQAAAHAKELATAINAVKMETLDMEVHMVWMKILQDLKKDTDLMSKTKDVNKQRKSFITLSNNIYQLMKVAKYETPVYYQYCPMANDGKGANWLSQESAVKNPYYGAQMLSCGKTVETIE